MSSLILTLDVGTSSLRTMLYDAQGSALSEAEVQITHSAHVTPDGGVELDPEVLFANAVRAIDGILPRVPPGQTIAGVATCTLWHSVLGVDPSGAAITPLYTWADTRATAAAAELRTRLDQDAVHARTGCFLHPSYLPARLLWLSRAQPEAWRRAARWVSFGEYLHQRLLGKAICSISMASGTGLLDVHCCAWDQEVLDAIGLDPQRLSPLGDTADAVAGLRPEWAARWPALAAVPWLPALGDGACSNVGSGCVSARRIALMVGTSGALRVVVETPDAPVMPGLWWYRVDRRRPLLGGALSEGGNLVAWMRATLQLDALPDLEAEIAAMAPDAHGLTVLPFLAGERSPGWAAQARGAIAGLSLATHPVEILRAGLEAIAYRFALIQRRLAAVAAPDAEVIASGGALLSSPAWMGMMADVLGRRVVALGEHEASSRGAALLALEALDLLPDIAAVPTTLGATYEPDAARHARYQEGIARQSHLYELLVKTSTIE
jgi:gluconokinase